MGKCGQTGKLLAALLVNFLLLAGCAVTPAHTPKPIPSNGQPPVELKEPVELERTIKSLAERYQKAVPHQWGEKVTGVVYKLDTTQKVVALTFDACGGAKGQEFDSRLIDFLNMKKVPTTLFINSRWIDANPQDFRRLAENPLFEIENHGFKHKPLSINCKKAYGIGGTASIREVAEEVELNARKIEKLTGRKPRFFRSGTAYYDEVAVQIVHDLGYQIVNFNVLGDAGATFSEVQVKKALLQAKPGSIIILHMNHPESGTAAGVIDGVKELKSKGFEFVKLADFPLVTY